MRTSRESDFVTLIASLKGSETVWRRIRREYVIQLESSFLEQYIENGADEILVPLRRPENLNVILKYFYEGQLNVSERNLESLWNDAKLLGLGNVEEACIQRMIDTMSANSWIQRMQFSLAEGCLWLELNVFNFVSANVNSCFSSSSFTSLSVDQVISVLQLPAVKSAFTEFRKIGLILDWIKVDEKERCPQAHRLLETVDLMKLTENSLRLFFVEEAAFRHWRCTSIIDRVIRLKQFEEAARESVSVPTQAGGFTLPKNEL